MSENLRGKLHHVELYISDLNRSKDFWGWFLPLLGYREYQAWDKGVSYILDSTYIVFVQTESRFQDIPYHRCRTGLNHLAFHASGREEVDQITELLRSRGVTVLYEEKHPHAGGSNSYAVFFEDPDRIKVEVVAP